MEFSSRERRRPAGISANTIEDDAEIACFRHNNRSNVKQKPAGRRRSREEKIFSCVIGYTLTHEELSPWERRRPAGISANTTEDDAEIACSRHNNRSNVNAYAAETPAFHGQLFYNFCQKYFLTTYNI
jgi:hypothetical protein